jgi:hypothetical protein
MNDDALNILQLRLDKMVEAGKKLESMRQSGNATDIAIAQAILIERADAFLERAAEPDQPYDASGARARLLDGVLEDIPEIEAPKDDNGDIKAWVKEYRDVRTEDYEKLRQGLNAALSIAIAAGSGGAGSPAAAAAILPIIQGLGSS